VASATRVHSVRSRVLAGKDWEFATYTLRAVGIDPIMAEATARRQDWSARIGLRSRFGPTGPRTYREVLDALEQVEGAK
jgi:hypothetical protein